jgi:hypothetical protein
MKGNLMEKINQNQAIAEIIEVGTAFKNNPRWRW